MPFRNKILLSLFSAHVLAGVLAGLLEQASREQGLVEYGLSIALIIAIYVWCKSDANSRKPGLVGRWALWSALLSPVVLPVYLFKTRPPRQAFKMLAKAFGTYIGLALVFVLTATAVALMSAA